MKFLPAFDCFPLGGGPTNWDTPWLQMFSCRSCYNSSYRWLSLHSLIIPLNCRRAWKDRSKDLHCKVLSNRSTSFVHPDEVSIPLRFGELVQSRGGSEKTSFRALKEMLYFGEDPIGKKLGFQRALGVTLLIPLHCITHVIYSPHKPPIYLLILCKGSINHQASLRRVSPRVPRSRTIPGGELPMGALAEVFYTLHIALNC